MNVVRALLRNEAATMMGDTAQMAPCRLDGTANTPKTDDAWARGLTLLTGAFLLAAAVAVQAAPASAAPKRDSTVPALRQLIAKGEVAEAETQAAQALEAIHPVHREDSLLVLQVTEVLIQTKLRLGHYDEPSMTGLTESFLKLCASLLDHNAVETALAHKYAAGLARSRGQNELARVHYQQALDITVERFGENDPETAKALSSLATAYSGMRNHREGRDLLERSLTILRAKRPAHDVDAALTLLNLNEERIALGDTVDVAAGYAVAAAAFRHHGLLNRLADTLQREGTWRLQGRDASGAARALERAVAIFEVEAPGSQELASCLRELARAHLARAEIDSALVRGTQAVRICETLGSGGPELADGLIVLGDVARERSRHSEAMTAYTRALGMLRGPPVQDPGRLAACLRAMAAQSLELAQFEGAVEYSRAALDIAERQWGSDDRETAVARVAYAIALQSAQRPDSAFAHHTRALATLTRIGGESHPTLAAPLIGLGTLARERGDISHARTLVERALRLREQAFGSSDPSLVGCLHELAVIKRRLGDEAGAKESLERSLQLAMIGKRESAAVAGILGSMATLERARGDTGAASGHFREALAILERVLPPDHPQFANMLRSLASLENADGQFAEAEANYARALTILSKVSPGHPDVAATHLGLGNTFKARGEVSQAYRHYHRAIEIHRAALGPTTPALALDYHNLAALLLESGMQSAAMDTAVIAEDISLRHFRTVASGASEREALDCAAARVTGTDIALTCAARSSAAGDWQRAWSLVMRSRAVVLEEVAERHRSVTDARDSTLGRLALARTIACNQLTQTVVRGRGQLTSEQYQTLVAAATRSKEAAERALAERSEPFRRYQARQEVGFTEVAAALPSGSALIAWVRFERLERGVSKRGRRDQSTGTSGAISYGAFVLGPRPEQLRFAVLGTADDIEPLIAQWHREAANGTLTRGPDAAWQAYLQAGQAVRRAIWDPIATAIDGATRIFLVPEGAVSILNFDALPDDAGAYLAEHLPVLQVLSSERDVIGSSAKGGGYGLLTVAAADFAGSRTPPPRAGPAETGRSAGRGIPCPQFRSLHFDSLPGTRVEGRAVVQLWRKFGAPVDTDPAQRHSVLHELAGSTATESNFRLLAPGRYAIHLATHGFFLGADCVGRRARGATEPDEIALAGLMADSPLLLSGLALSGANTREQAPSAENDGILTAEEIASMNLAGVEWVVLSACETGLGKIESGEGVFGLRRAFQIAGVRNLVMSLWAVNDSETALWMEKLFEQRLRGRNTGAQSVRAASLAVLRHRRAEGLSTHPYFWGAFVATGD